MQQCTFVQTSVIKKTSEIKKYYTEILATCSEREEENNFNAFYILYS